VSYSGRDKTNSSTKLLFGSGVGGLCLRERKKLQEFPVLGH